MRNIPNIKVTDINHFSAFDIIKFKNYDIKKLGYFERIVEYKKAREESVKMYRKVL